jgi:GNAT superfamily N-acetyltransferase
VTTEAVEDRMVNSQRDLKIRQVREGEGEEFAAWLSDLTASTAESPDLALLERHLLLTDEVGDWIGGARFLLRGGVAHLVDIGVVPSERGQGHALRLLEAFEQHAREAGAHLIEFATDRFGIEPLLAALGWEVVVTRPGYIGGRTWYLLAKRLGPAPTAP